VDDNRRVSAVRPSPWQWVRYAVGGRLPTALHDWVRHDLTDADWRWRQVVRVLVQIALPVLVIALLPAPAGLRALMVLLVVLGTLSIGLAYGDELRDRRLRQHGLIPPAQPEQTGPAGPPRDGPPPPEPQGPPPRR
jgi:hypothetical protein